MKPLLQELKRRHVYRVTAVYVIASWLLLQVANTLFPAFGVRDDGLRMLALTLLFSFPVVLLFTWAFEFTPDGIKKTLAAQPGDNTGVRKIMLAIELEPDFAAGWRLLNHIDGSYLLHFSYLFTEDELVSILERGIEYGQRSRQLSPFEPGVCSCLAAPQPPRHIPTHSLLSTKLHQFRSIAG